MGGCTRDTTAAQACKGLVRSITCRSTLSDLGKQIVVTHAHDRQMPAVTATCKSTALVAIHEPYAGPRRPAPASSAW